MNAFLRMLTWGLAVALVALPVVALVNGWVGSDAWPLRTLQVHGEFQRVDAGKVREQVLPFARKGFFAIELDDAQAAVAALPWVEQAQVRKRWPDALDVTIIEHEPFARWGDDRLLSVHGQMFPVDGIELSGELPRLSGPDTQVEDVVAFYNTAQALFAGMGQVRSLALDQRGSWSLTLSSGTRVLIGRNDMRPRLARFAHALPTLRAHASQPLARADLRYTNGFALVWGEVPEAGQDEAGAGQSQASSTRRDRLTTQLRLAPPASATASFFRFPSPISGFQT